jgi:hypothetical protein
MTSTTSHGPTRKLALLDEYTLHIPYTNHLLHFTCMDCFLTQIRVAINLP